MFHIGQKVECIRDVNELHIRFGEHVPLKGTVYTIRDIVADCSDGSLGLRLGEIVNPTHRYAEGTRECSFDQDGFRPIVERKTDISIFTEMLTPAPKRARETTEG